MSSESAKEVVERVFSDELASMIWTANTFMVFPPTVQHFAVGSVLPAVFYMFRRGHRRGRGEFQTAFSPPGELRPTIASVAVKLSSDKTSFSGFESEVTKEVLGDLLLCDALENKAHAEGQEEDIQRAYPVHYLASWLDLPKAVAHLRFVPEMLVMLLAQQGQGTRLESRIHNAEFPVGVNPEENLLFRIFAKGVRFGTIPGALRGHDVGDSVQEEWPFSVEELLMIRLAQACGEAPERLRKTHGAFPEIQNLWPIARRATDVFRNDLIIFLRHYGEVVPRRALTPMLESLVGLGLWHIFLGCLSLAVTWDRKGSIPASNAQMPVLVFVDASCGAEAKLRDLSEQAIEEVLRLFDEATPALMAIRLMDAKGRFDLRLHHLVPKGPDATDWLNLLAQVRSNAHERSSVILNDLSEKAEILASRLEDQDLESEVQAILRSPRAAEDPVRALADSLCLLMGEKLLRSNPLRFFDACLMINEPNGLGRKRRVYRVLGGGCRKALEARSVVLSNTLLEALVHRHLVEQEGKLSFAGFLRILREQYGLCIDECPPGVAATSEDLRRNRDILERRLRDLGFLVGVNDAESMKHLRGRFRPKESA